MLEIRNVTRAYGHGPSRVLALDGVSLRVEKGEFVAVTGPSGSGKTTLLNVIGGLDGISGGEVFLEGERIDNLSEADLVGVRRKKIAYVFQQYHLVPSLTALENVLLPLTFSSSRNGAHARGTQMLQKVGLSHRAHHKPSELSGGEQQRVAIARALINNCSLVLADEPTGNLDRKTGAGILELFTELNQEGYTLILVTHSPETARLARRIVSMEDGRIVKDTIGA
ncbi:MAG: ABC transporter ATP-binding protein [Chloroflexi bacterium]|nr:ABC transporter ATP-binding protein [Chloroflexota bacterium]